MILTVTPGINLSSVTGPISKAQLNQLGQPTVALSPGSVVASDTNFTSLRITDGVYPFLQLTNLSAPTDKKRFRAYVETSGTVGLARTNDAENVGFPLASWDVNNNCGINQGVPQAKLHVAGGVVGSSAGSSAEMFRAEWNNGNVSTLRLLQVRNSTGTNWETTTTRLQQFTDATPQGFIEFNPAGLNYGVALGTTNGSNVNAPMLFLTGAAGGNNVGIGTTVTPDKLSVSGNVRLTANNTGIVWTDQSGTMPYMTMGSDGNFYFTGTTAAGAGRGIWQCAMRSDTSPLQVNVPLKIGASAIPLKSVLKATVTQTGTTISAGSFHLANYTVTGATIGAMVHIQEVQTSVTLMARCNTNDSVQVWYGNNGAASVSLATQPIDIFVFNV
jgi:hypothetical protein